jgi:hypothetical protein
VFDPTTIGIEYVTRNESGPDPAGDRLQFALTDQCASVVLRATELGGNLTDCQGFGPLHLRSIAAASDGGRETGRSPSEAATPAWRDGLLVAV